MPANETQSLHRAISILDCFRAGQPELGVREIARQLDLHPATVGRMLATMASIGVLTQDKETSRYRMGSKVLKWAAVYLSSIDLRVEARPFMEELHKITHETVSLYIPDGDARICVDRLESPQIVRMVARVGERMPLYAGASGKALLAFLPPEQQMSIIKNNPLERLTTNTIQDSSVLLQELALIKERGYAFSKGERVEGASSVAAPIFDTTRKVIGAMNISGPSTRFSEEKIQEYAAILLEATRQISQVMGYPSKEIV